MSAQRKPHTGQSLAFYLINQLGNALLLDERLLDASADQPLLEISVIICTRNRPDSLDTCLRALSQQVSPPAEIVVVPPSVVAFTWTRRSAPRTFRTCIAGNRIRIIRASRNSPVALARASASRFQRNRENGLPASSTVTS